MQTHIPAVDAGCYLEVMEEWEEEDRRAERIAARAAKKQQENDPA